MPSLDKALEAARAGRVEEALAILTELSGSASTAQAALGHRAWLLKGVGRHEEALRDYDRLLELQPGEPEALRQRADTLRRLGRLDEALRELLALLQRNPLDLQTTRMLAACQEAGGAAMVPEGATLPIGDPPPMRALNPVLDALERDTRSYPTSSFPEVGRMLYCIARCLRPAMVVETGCYIGYSTLCLAQAMEDNGGGHLHSFDLFPPDKPVHSPIAGECADTFQAARAHVERSGLGHRITLHRGDSAKNIAEVFGQIQKTGGATELVDLAFIDGDHTITGCRKDFHVVDPILKPGGVILLHDTIPSRCGWAGPRHLLEELPKESQGKYQCINLPSPEGYGLALLQKTGGEVVGRWRPSIGDLLAERILMKRYWQ